MEEAIAKLGLGYFRPAPEEETLGDRYVDYATLADVKLNDPIMGLIHAGHAGVAGGRDHTKT